MTSHIPERWQNLVCQADNPNHHFLSKGEREAIQAVDAELAQLRDFVAAFDEWQADAQEDIEICLGAFVSYDEMLAARARIKETK